MKLPGSHQGEVTREYLQRAKEFDRKLGTSEGAEGPVPREVRSFGSRVHVFVADTFAEMPSDVGTLAGVIASALAADHTQSFSNSAAEAKGVYT